jgi:hypothetical protein
MWNEKNRVIPDLGEICNPQLFQMKAQATGFYLYVVNNPHLPFDLNYDGT